MSTISFNPTVTTNAAGSFGVSSDGWMQGTFVDDPAIRNELVTGYVEPNETLPMWGGIAISDFVPPGASGTTTNMDFSMGPALKRATSVTAPTTGQSNNGQVTGITVFNQAHNMIQSPQSPVPVALLNNTISFFRMGSGARIAVAVDPALINLEAYLTTSLVSWDYVAQMLIPYNAAYNANVITAASWASTSGGQVTFTTTTNHGVAVGADFEITGMTPAGYNGRFIAVAGTATNSLVAALTANPGASTVQGTLVAGGGALPCKVIEVQKANSMTVNYNATTGAATWNRSGSTAIILI